MDNFIGVFDTDYDTDPIIQYFKDCTEAGLVIPRNIMVDSINKVQDSAITFPPILTPTLISIRKDIQASFLQDYGKYTVAAFTEYTKKYTSLQAVKLQQLVMNMQCTKPEEGYHTWHCENSYNGARMCATMMYLNEDFEGGELEFLYQSLRIKPKKGRFIIFPATYTHLHRGNPPLSGKKYILTSWLEQQG